MKTIMLCAVFLIGIFSSSFAKTIPNYIKPCNVSDLHFEECAIKNGEAAIPFISKGDKKYNIPSFEPLKIEKLLFDAGSLKINFDNMEIRGLEKSQILSIKYDKEEQAMFITVQTPTFDIKSHYVTKGSVLVLPVEGDGEFNLNLVNVTCHCSVFLDNFRPGSTDPIIFKDSNVTYTVSDSTYDIKNLFNGNKQLGDNINKVLNENHENLYQDFAPVVSETINTVLKAIVNGIIKDIYFKDAFFS